MADNNRPNRPNRSPQGKPNTRFGNLFVAGLFLVFVIVIIYAFTNDTTEVVEYEYSQYIEELDNLKIKTAVSSTVTGGDNIGVYRIDGELIDGETQYFVIVPSDEALDTLVNTYFTTNFNIDYSHEPANSFDFWNIAFFVVPIIIVVVLIAMMMRGNAGNNRAFEFGKNRAKLNKGKTTTFKNVAGIEEEKQEMEEVIDFLKNPKKYMELGARIPKGILLVGPPGTGKTLLARAVAGEASVPFYSISGSDFVEMFVGVGASRVRDMFKTAKQNAPCIVFIDEIDAVGRQRGAGLGGGHDEREQTLNQLLVEMDGFGNNSGIIVIAATNRPDVLDPAILRPGRFDRQIMIGTPDIKGRKAILQVHARNKKIDPKVTFDEIARRTPGFTGADLENLLNEAALLAARESKPHIKLYHIDEAVDRVMMGPAKKSRVFTKRERDFIAHHEAGHAVIGIKLDNAHVVHKVTIIPRGRAGGYNLMLPEEEESFLATKQGLLSQITGLLGGRVAEELVFNEVSTGAYNDFQRATAIARAMVTEYGMSALGPVQYEKRGGGVFLGRDYVSDKSFSDQVALEIDNEVRNIIDSCYQEAKKVLSDNMDLLLLIAKTLLDVETLTKEDIYEIVESGKLGWWEKKKAKAEKKAADAEAVADTTEAKEEETPTTEEKTEKTEE